MAPRSASCQPVARSAADSQPDIELQVTQPAASQLTLTPAASQLTLIPFTLRTMLEPRSSRKFAFNGVADEPVSEYEVDLRLAAMKTAIVAHDALTRRLSRVDSVELPENMSRAIEMSSAFWFD